MGAPAWFVEGCFSRAAHTRADECEVIKCQQGGAGRSPGACLAPAGLTGHRSPSRGGLLSDTQCGVPGTVASRDAHGRRAGELWGASPWDRHAAGSPTGCYTCGSRRSHPGISAPPGPTAYTGVHSAPHPGGSDRRTRTCAPITTSSRVPPWPYGSCTPAWPPLLPTPPSHRPESRLFHSVLQLASRNMQPSRWALSLSNGHLIRRCHRAARSLSAE